MTRTYLPRAFAAGARILCEHRLDQIVLIGPAGDVGRVDRPGAARRRTGDRRRSRSVMSSCAVARSRRRRSCSVRASAAGSAARSPSTRRSSSPPASTMRSTPERRVGPPGRKQFAPNISFGGSASHPGLVALALTDNWRDSARRSRPGRRSRSTTPRSPARAAAWSQAIPGCAIRSSPTGSRSATGAARPRTRSPGDGDARGRRRGGVSVVQGAPIVRTAPIWRR